MDDGDVYIFDLNSKTFTGFKIDYNKLFASKPPTRVTDIKCHPTKMHRLLIAYEHTAITVFSINKNRFIQRIMVSSFDDSDTLPGNKKP
jgi:hypothetical protein